MSKKKTAIVLGLLGTGILAASARFYMKVQEDRQKAQALEQVRAFFAPFGTIVTVFVYEQEATKDFLKGGVVMEEGSVYLFENDRGQISYEEEK